MLFTFVFDVNQIFPGQVLKSTRLFLWPFAVRSNYEDGGTGAARKHDFTRSESENWRMSRDEQNGEDDEGGWRLAGSRRDGDRWCAHSPGAPAAIPCWKPHPRPPSAPAPSPAPAPCPPLPPETCVPLICVHVMSKLRSR